MPVNKSPGLIRSKTLIIILLIILAGLAILAAASGAVRIPPFTAGRIILSRLPLFGQRITATWPPAWESIIISLRLRRIVLAILVGYALALAGTVFQGVLQNPLADPYIIGVSSGAALGATVAIVSGFPLRLLGIGAVPVFSFAGALGSLTLAYRLARRGRAVPMLNLLLSGIAVGSFFSALVSLLIFYGRESMEQVVFWMMGGLSHGGWRQVWGVVPYIIGASGVVLAHTREMNALLLGDAAAYHLGVDVEKVRRRLIFTGALLTASAVAVSGLIGFVGLIVPHMMRLFTGPDHRRLLPAAAIGGAILLLLADTAARSVLPPAEIPVGIITALCGAPFFLYLLHRRNKD
ncbi:MAG: FecCD family ABC transporter permease [bacterium]